jgi:hypothetical protein
MNQVGPLFQVECPLIVLLCFCVIEQLWTAEDVNKALNAFRDGRSIRHAADGDTTNSKGGTTVFTPGEGADILTGIVQVCLLIHTGMASSRSHPSVGKLIERLRNTTTT